MRAQWTRGDTKHNVTEAVKATPGIVVLDANGVYEALHNRSSAASGLTKKCRVAGTRGQHRRARYRHQVVPQ